MCAVRVFKGTKRQMPHTGTHTQTDSAWSRLAVLLQSHACGYFSWLHVMHDPDPVPSRMARRSFLLRDLRWTRQHIAWVSKLVLRSSDDSKVLQLYPASVLALCVYEGAPTPRPTTRPGQEPHSSTVYVVQGVVEGLSCPLPRAL